MLPSRPKSKSTIVHHISVLDKPRRSLSVADHDECLLAYAKSCWNPEWLRKNLFCGELSKQSSSIYKGWHRRWLILTHEALFYFRKKPESVFDDMLPMGILFFDTSVSVENVEIDTATAAYGFKITVPSSCSLESMKVYERRSYIFLALSDADRIAWTAAIRKASGHSSNSPLLSKRVDVFRQDSENEEELFKPQLTEKTNDDSQSSLSMDSHTRVKHLSIPSNSSGSLKTPNSRPISALSSQLANAESSLLMPCPSIDSSQITPPTSLHSFPTLYSVFVEVYQHLNDYSILVQSSFDRISNEAAINYLEPATAVIRSVRHLLYFADSRFTKSMQNTDLTACLGKHMSVVIDRTRKIGFHAKHLTEEECMGFRNSIAVQTLLDNVDELQSELHIFVNVSKTLSDLDLILTHRSEIIESLKPSAPGRLILSQLINKSQEMAQYVSAAEKQKIVDSVHSLIAFVSDFCIVIDPLLPQIYIPSCMTNSMDMHVNLNKLLIIRDEFTQSFTWTTQHEQDLRAALELDYRNWEMVEIHITEKYFSLLFLLIRQTISLLFSENEASSKIPFTALWLQLDTSLNAARKSLKTSLRQSMSLPVSFVNNGHRVVRGSYPDMQLSCSPSYTSLREDHAALMNSYANTVRTYSDASSVSLRRSAQRAQDRIDYTEPIIVKGQLPPSVSAMTVSINQAVFRSASELTALIIDVSNSLVELTRNAYSTARKPSDTNLDRIVQMALSIVTAANQVEEELASLEGVHVEEQLFLTIEESLQSHSRAISAFELAIKNLTSFFAPENAIEQVCNAAQEVNQKCVALEASMKSLLDQQLGELLNVLNIDGSSLEPPPTPPRSPIFPDILEETAEQADEKFVSELLETEMNNFESDATIIIRRGSDNEQLIKGGTLQKLVEKLTFHKLPPTDYTSAFLLTYRSFTTADCLLKLLIDRYTQISPPAYLSESQKKCYISKKIVPVRLRIFNVIKMWIKHNFEDFERDPELLEVLLAFLPVIKEDFHKGAVDFEKLLFKKKRGDVNTIVLHHRCPPPPPILPRNLNSFCLPDLDPMEIARQLTIIQSSMFFSIKPSECMNQSWNRKQYHHRSPHIRGMIQLSNHIVQWVATEIITAQSLKVRVSIMKHFVMTAEKLKQLNNFDGLKSVLCGLQASGIRRLSKTWECLSNKHRTLFEDLSALMSEEKSFKNYRSFLHSIDPPCIPFLGVYLTDLTMIDTGNADRIKNNEDLINFHKHYLEAQVIQEIRRYQCTAYNLTEIPLLTRWIKDYKVKDPQEIYDLSLAIEPRSSSAAAAPDTTTSTSFNFSGTRTSFIGKKPSFLLRLGSTVGSIQKEF